MQNLTTKDKELLLKLTTDGLTPVQVRLFKTIHSLLSDILAPDNEAEYFEASAELLKKTAELIKHSNFAVLHKEMSYGDQAVEFAMDALNECLEGNKIQNLDN
jgi:hypothetical protein